MKTKHILTLATLLIVAIVFTSCNKTNFTPPTITLNQPAENPWVINLYANVIDPGATAMDNKGNNITSSVISTWSTGNPNQNLVGTYTITYTVADANGNTASATRTVIVIVAPSCLLGHWSVDDLIDTTNIKYTDSLTTFVSNPNNIYVTSFADYAGAALYFNLSGTSGTTVLLPPQSVTCGTGVNQKLRAFKGSGSVAPDGSSITINYGVVNVGLTDTVKGIETYSSRTSK
jgi:hypothetical protein